MNDIVKYQPTLPQGWEAQVPVALRTDVSNFDTPQIRQIDVEDLRKTVAGLIVRLSSFFRKPVDDDEVLSISSEVSAQILTSYPTLRKGELMNVINSGIEGEFGVLHDLSAITPALILKWVRAYFKGERRESVRKAYLSGKKVTEKLQDDFKGKSVEEYSKERIEELRADYKAGKPIRDHKLYAINYLIHTGEIELTVEQKNEIREKARATLKKRYLAEMQGGGYLVTAMVKKRLAALEDDNYTPLKLECSAIVLREYFSR